MTSPYTSVTTSRFTTSGDILIDSLLTEVLSKWGGSKGTGAQLSFSFPYVDSMPVWLPFYGSETSAGSIQHGFSTLQMASVRSILQSFSNVVNLSLTEIPETSTNVGDLRYAFTSLMRISALGESFYPDSIDPHSGDVWLKTVLETGYQSSKEWMDGSYGYSLLLHEIGHSLGLKHPNHGAKPYIGDSLDSKIYTVMSYFNTPKGSYFDAAKGVSFSVYPDTPMVYDIQALQYLYGANTSYHSGNDVYTFDPTTLFYKTIWDAGGADTIDISNYKLNSKIDLGAGSYSDLGFKAPNPNPENQYDGTNALSIAFGVTIENIIGGSGNDILIGNSVNNSLTPGFGDNTVDGDQGFDTVVLSGNWDDYIFSNATTNQIKIVKFDSTETDLISNIETIKFADGSSKDVVNGAVQNSPDAKSPIAIVPIISVPIITTPVDNSITKYRNGTTNLDDFSYAGNRLDYDINKNSDGTWKIDKKSPIEHDVLYNLERIHFADKTIALDIDGNAGKAYRLYKAAFDREPDLPGLGHWIKALDTGSSVKTVANGFIGSQEFIAMYGANTSNVNLITKFYQHALHREPELAGLNNWVNVLNAKTLSVAEVMNGFSESTENQAQVIGLIQHGIEYIA